jgi:serine/threonine protein phosphatase 1
MITLSERIARLTGRPMSQSNIEDGQRFSEKRRAPFLWPLFRRRSASAASGHRVYAIGDVHGRLDLLDRLLGEIERDAKEREPAKISVVLLGDMIDRGPDSRGVLHRAMAGLEWATLYGLRGNHEQMLLAVLDGDRSVAVPWLEHGGRETLASWGVDASQLSTADADEIVEVARGALSALDKAALRHLPYRLRSGDYMFVHAGIRPGVALGQQRTDDLLWIREPFLSSRRDHGAVIIHGHSVSPEIEEHANRIGIDTGAYQTGRLTALVLEGATRRYLCAEFVPSDTTRVRTAGERVVTALTAT